MSVQIGAKAHNFSEPTGLLSDCHRRIEMFLGSLERLSLIIDRPLTEENRGALETALRYFREAAPKHTADEEESLFPRLRQLSDPDMHAAIERMERLVADHRHAEDLHREIEELGLRCLTSRPLSPTESGIFREAIASLISMYDGHIKIEDELVFPLAARLLPSAGKAAIGEEMAARRRPESGKSVLEIPTTSPTLRL